MRCFYLCVDDHTRTDMRKVLICTLIDSTITVLKLILLAIREDVRAMQRKQLKFAHIFRSNDLPSGHNRYLGAIVSTFRALQTVC